MITEVNIIGAKMNIIVYGSKNCSGCKRFYQTVAELAEKMPQVHIEFVSDIKIILSKGIMQLPALEIDGNLRISGRTPKINELNAIFKEVKN